MPINASQKPLRIVNSVAPIRICDNGGWTDTWFAEHGKIFSIAAYPVQSPNRSVLARCYVLEAASWGLMRENSSLEEVFNRNHL